MRYGTQARKVAEPPTPGREFGVFAYRQRDGGLVYLTHDRYFAHMRGEPAFQALLKTLNLAS